MGPKFFNFENFFIFLVECKILWEKTKLFSKQLFSEVAPSILALFGKILPAEEKLVLCSACEVRVPPGGSQGGRGDSSFHVRGEGA